MKKSGKNFFILELLLDFGRTLIISLFFLAFYVVSFTEKSNFRYVPFGFLYAVYWCYSPCTTKESSVLPSLILSEKIFEIRNHFSELQMPLPLERTGSYDIGFLFYPGYFRRIPAVSPENFSKHITSYFLFPCYIFLYKGSLFSPHMRIRSPPIHSCSYFSAFESIQGTVFFRHIRCMCNVIKIMVSMTKKKAHLPYTKQIGRLFSCFLDLALWVMNISQFAFIFPMSVNATVMNIYLSVLSEQFAN